MRYPAFIGGSYESQSPLAASERTVNFYVERLESPGAKNRAALYPSPGLRSFVTVTDSPVRALAGAPGGRAFALVAGTLYEIFANGTATSRATIGADVRLATISHNGPNGGQLFITSANQGFVYTLATNTLTPVLSSGARMGAMLDGYFVALDDQASKFRISKAFDGLVWDATQVAQRSLMPDPWIAMRVFNREIWLFGEQTTEVWYNTGQAPFPFAPRPGALIQTGIAAPWSAAVVGDTLCWLARSAEGQGMVVAARGYTPQRISTHAVELAIRRYSRIDDAEAFGYEQDGHRFYVLNFPTAEATWVFDLATGLWSERGRWLPALGRYTTWAPRVYGFLFGKRLVGLRDSGAIAELDPTVSTEADGSVIRRIRRAPGILREHQWLFYPKLELYLEPGLGVPGQDPQVTLAWSDDGGKTWSPQLRATVSAGATGRYQTRVVWRRLGRSRDRVFEFEMSDAIPWRVIDAYVDVRPGSGA